MKKIFRNGCANLIIFPIFFIEAQTKSNIATIQSTYQDPETSSG
jgi:hypothetical protein